MILSSRAESVFDIKTPYDFIAFFKQAGLSDEEIEKSFESSANIIKFNNNRDKLIFKGVRRVDDGS